MIIGAVPHAVETYSNCAVFFYLIQFDGMESKLSTDLKLGISIIN